ncbi:hypothetical protein ACH474_21580 [Nocardia rhamnosiphila]|uniref:hypothetical protein n=1 Tax=Nocardia rhamnosiphila TaxID=426716 RepID=UPI000A5D89EF|nr:hypothetical protein [Nocardia rhamnosiphila]
MDKFTESRGDSTIIDRGPFLIDGSDPGPLRGRHNLGPARRWRGCAGPILIVAVYRGDESERLTDTLGSLARAAPLRLELPGLLDEPGPGRVRFVHTLVRDTLVTDVSRIRTTRMHARIAAALEGSDDIAALAHHYARAGSPKAVG